jgi:mannose/fructose/N-acetylgalactosamine-specific phosphotransferase system component IIC
MTFDCFFVHMADKYIEEEKYNKIYIKNKINSCKIHTKKKETP